MHARRMTEYTYVVEGALLPLETADDWLGKRCPVLSSKITIPSAPSSCITTASKREGTPRAYRRHLPGTSRQELGGSFLFRIHVGLFHLIPSCLSLVALSRPHFVTFSFFFSTPQFDSLLLPLPRFRHAFVAQDASPRQQLSFLFR